MSTPSPAASNDAASTEAARCLAELKVPHLCDAPLGPKTWYGVGGKAEALAQPETVEQLATVMRHCHERNIPVRVLGSGANLLVVDDVPGMVIELTAPAFCELRGEDTRLTVGAGYDLFKLVLDAARRGLAGLEQVAGIPARVGGAVRMNAGGAYGDIGAHVQRVRVMEWTGEIHDLPRNELSFGYRRTNIDAPIIVEVEFAMDEDEPEALMRRVKEIFFYKKTSQPMGANSAGCAFKNPPRDVEAGGEQGLSAGALIERAGLKGYRLGQAGVSEVHANFVVTEAGAEARDVLAVIEHVQAEVAQQFDVRLEREVVVWP